MIWYMVAVCAGAAIASVSGRSTSDSLLVNIEQGPVRGYKPPQGGLYVFYNIPYATAPRGSQRFRPPLPPPTWTEPFEAILSNVITCPQPIPPPWGQEDGTLVQEDCLVANVYVPDTEEENLPVVVYHHGGAFQLGRGTDMAATTLVRTRNIVAVSFNYRLGAHGLLCLGTKGIPGNAGMKDQVALLRWVQKNIAQFRGNPNDVTIDGWSAGASSVDLIMISKTARGLFHKVIPESGGNSASFSVQVDPLANARNVAKELKFNGDLNDLEALEDFFLNAPLESLWSVDVLSSKNSSVVFAPCIERDIGEEMFLDDHPVNIFKSGDYPKVPMLYGIAEMEGIMRQGFFRIWRDRMNERFSDFFPEDLQFTSEDEEAQVGSKVKQFYFGDAPVSETNILSYIDYFTDVMFGYGTARAIQYQVEAGNNQIFVYIYGFVDESQSYIPHTNVRGATHCAQTDAVMDLGDESKLSAEYQKMKAVMRDLWGNFITTGKPVPEGSSYPAWPPVGADRAPYMYLNSTLELRGSFLGDRARFWDEIYRKHFRIPIPPTD